MNILRRSQLLARIIWWQIWLLARPCGDTFLFFSVHGFPVNPVNLTEISNTSLSNRGLIGHKTITFLNILWKRTKVNWHRNLAAGLELLLSTELASVLLVFIGNLQEMIVGIVSYNLVFLFLLLLWDECVAQRRFHSLSLARGLLWDFNFAGLHLKDALDRVWIEAGEHPRLTQSIFVSPKWQHIIRLLHLLICKPWRLKFFEQLWWVS